MVESRVSAFEGRRLRPIVFPASRRASPSLPVAVVALAVLVPLALLVGAAFLFGWRFQPIETGSMAPRFPAGALAVVEPVDPADVEAGMTIVFEDPSDRSRLVAHRAIKRMPGSVPAWQTKGDANAEADPFPVHASAVQGRVRWVIPGAGSVVTAVRGPQAVALFVGLPLLLFAISEFRGARLRRRIAR